MEKTDEGKTPTTKKPYTPPKLVRYGDVRALTHAQASGSTEASMGSGVMKSTSDRRLKENIARVGAHPLGFGLYLFDYKPCFRDEHGHARQFGVMADEVRSILPQAVSIDDSGFERVDYDMLGIRRAIR